MYLLELGVAPKRNSRATDESQARTRSILLATARLIVTEKIPPISATFLAHMHAFRASRRLVGECMMREEHSRRATAIHSASHRSTVIGDELVQPCWQRPLDANEHTR
jgi:hypothetical protein